MNAMTPFLSGAAFGHKDPTSLVWPPTLPIELALKTASPSELQVEYGYSDEDWDALPRNPFFMKDLMGACELVRQEGMSFKLKAKLIAEENLKTTWKMIHATHTEVTPSVKKDLILAVARWAGYDIKPGGEGGPGSGPVNPNTLNIQINLGADY
jgi:hypothetical protein